MAAWVDLIHSADVTRFAVKQGKSKALPAEEPHPRTSLTGLNLRHVRELGVPVFVPEPGNVFLTVRLTDLRLRCLAALCRSKYVRAMASLYCRFNTGKDPIHCWPEEAYIRLARDCHWEEAEKEFDNLRQIRPEDVPRSIRLARGVLETLPLGLPAALSLRILRNEFALEEVDETEWKNLAEIILNGAVMEMQPFLFYDVAETLATILRFRSRTVRKRLGVGRLNPRTVLSMTTRSRRYRGPWLGDEPRHLFAIWPGCTIQRMPLRPAPMKTYLRFRNSPLRGA